jgi:hypothetical protein
MAVRDGRPRAFARGFRDKPARNLAAQIDSPAVFPKRARQLLQRLVSDA